MIETELTLSEVQGNGSREDDGFEWDDAHGAAEPPAAGSLEFELERRSAGAKTKQVRGKADVAAHCDYP